MKILLLGKDGQVGWELQRALAPLGELVAPGLAALDLKDLDATRRFVRAFSPDAIVNAAAYTAVDKAESDPGPARRLNAEVVGVLAEEAHRLGAWLVHYSTDYVFDGAKTTPYVEDDPARPLSVYGLTKLEGEKAVRQHDASHLIFRTSWVYAVRGDNFAKTMLRLAKERESLKVVADQYGAPTSAELLADVTALALYRTMHEPVATQRPLAGTYHVAAGGQTTWHEYARYVLDLAVKRGVKLRAGPDRVEAITTEAYPVPAVRPKNSRLDTRKLQTTFNLRLPHWRYHVERMVEEVTSQGAI